MAIVALVLWTLTAGAGVFLLSTSTRPKAGAGEPDEDPAPALTAAQRAAGADGAAPATQVTPAVKKRDRFDPPSLRAAKSEPIPGGRALAEFTHPALALTGFAFWLLYTMVHDRIFGAIALGILLGAIAAGVSWALSNARGAKKADRYALTFSGRALAFHVAGAALTLLLAVLITARV